MLNNNTFNNNQIYYSTRNNNTYKKALNMKKSFGFNPLNTNQNNFSLNININDFSDIAYFETKQKINLVNFKIKKFKSFLDKSLIKNNNFSRNSYSNKYDFKYKSYDKFNQKLDLLNKKEENINDIADNIINAFNLDINNKNNEKDKNDNHVNQNKGKE